MNKVVANCEVRTEVSQTAVSVLTNRKAIRSDEVPHAAEVQSPERGLYRNSRCGRHRHKDIRLTEGGFGIDSFSMRQEVSRSHSS